ncbi:MAG: prepilin peptidase [Lachnospiraceae bacterium]|nr:prepilin peptidase [Lachnospiraceae bacterium]
MRELYTFTVLLTGSVMDFRRKALPRWFLVLSAAGGVLMLVFASPGWSDLLCGLLPGIILLLLGRFSGCIGMADGVLILVLGGLYGLNEGSQFLMYALLAAAVAALLLIGSRKAGRRSTMPFVPFLLAGFLLARLRLYINGG